MYLVKTCNKKKQKNTQLFLTSFQRLQKDNQQNMTN